MSITHTPSWPWLPANALQITINNLVKRVKRVSAFGFRQFKHYSLRALLYAGKPNWTLLNTITPP